MMHGGQRVHVSNSQQITAARRIMALLASVTTSAPPALVTKAANRSRHRRAIGHRHPAKASSCS